MLIGSDRGARIAARRRMIYADIDVGSSAPANLGLIQSAALGGRRFAWLP